MGHSTTALVQERVGIITPFYVIDGHRWTYVAPLNTALRSLLLTTALELQTQSDELGVS
jgi:hypothetical protein